jgi:hypothetical protein
MSSLLNLSIDTKKIAKSDFHKGQYLNITIAVNDEVNEYGQNVAAWIAQTEEERKSNAKNRKYCANGSVIWTDGKVIAAEKKEGAAKSKAPQNEEDGLPW